MILQEECLEKLNGILLTNLNWYKGLKAWNKVFKFFDNESDLVEVAKIGTTSRTPEDLQNNSQGKTYTSTTKPFFNDHPCDSKIMTIVDRLSFFRGHLYRDLKMMVVRDKWSLAQV
jgi:hypothetical protein